MSNIQNDLNVLYLFKYAIPKWYKEYEKGNISKYKAFQIAQDASNIGTLDKYFDQPNIYITFSDVKRFGFNPKYSFNTPFGIYAYPFDMKWASDPPEFAADRPFIHIFQVLGNTLDTDSYSKQDLIDDVNKLKTFFKLKKFNDLFRYAQNNAIIKSPAGILWNLTRLLSNEHNLKFTTEPYFKISNSYNTKSWSKILNSLGYSCIADYSSVIHPNEPTQALILVSEGRFPIKYIDTLNNLKLKKVDDKILKLNYSKSFSTLKDKFLSKIHDERKNQFDKIYIKEFLSGKLRFLHKIIDKINPSKIKEVLSKSNDPYIYSSISSILNMFSPDDPNDYKFITKILEKTGDIPMAFFNNPNYINFICNNYINKNQFFIVYSLEHIKNDSLLKKILKYLALNKYFQREMLLEDSYHAHKLLDFLSQYSINNLYYFASNILNDLTDPFKIRFINELINNYEIEQSIVDNIIISEIQNHPRMFKLSSSLSFNHYTPTINFLSILNDLNDLSAINLLNASNFLQSQGNQIQLILDFITDKAQSGNTHYSNFLEQLSPIK